MYFVMIIIIYHLYSYLYLINIEKKPLLGGTLHNNNNKINFVFILFFQSPCIRKWTKKIICHQLHHPIQIRWTLQSMVTIIREVSVASHIPHQQRGLHSPLQWSLSKQIRRFVSTLFSSLIFLLILLILLIVYFYYNTQLKLKDSCNTCFWIFYSNLPKYRVMNIIIN